MKKIITAALVAAVFGLVGCSTDKYVDKHDYDTVSVNHKTKCKHKDKRCYRHGGKFGKFGVERTAKDTVK